MNVYLRGLNIYQYYGPLKGVLGLLGACGNNGEPHGKMGVKMKGGVM